MGFLTAQECWDDVNNVSNGLCLVRLVRDCDAAIQESARLAQL